MTFEHKIIGKSKFTEKEIEEFQKDPDKIYIKKGFHDKSIGQARSFSQSIKSTTDTDDDIICLNSPKRLFSPRLCESDNEDFYSLKAEITTSTSEHSQINNRKEQVPTESSDTMLCFSDTLTSSSSVDDLFKKEFSYSDIENEDFGCTTECTNEIDHDEELNKRIECARLRYVEDVQEAIKYYQVKTSPSVSIDAPPCFEKMSDIELTDELKKYGFRFTNRISALEKLARCWAAVSQSQKTKSRSLNVIDFIRYDSKYYESILAYQPIYLSALFNEITNAGHNISLNKLRNLLDNEGVAYIEEK